ncbi:MAG: twin-arginine translocation signal domain-containing protein [Fuerstiella sp.]|jgi:hypothetical protein|nr:twin-arginine translocation signal domain-containing protein [Fuerstiella sp.]MCP4507257.1 twin-arginine translocation signal domain-containing protein [Fuerstiella sp.]MDG2129764.1 twin-arginine translocation signal domain-containing protein [Fuerstiella sp.]
MEESTPSRRQFLKHAGATSSLATAALTSMTQLQGQPVTSDERQSCLDYRRSFICGTSDLNSVRFWIESRTTITDTDTGEHAVFYQCASCKSENTFGESDLFLDDNYDFLPIFGDGHWLIMRRHARMDTERYRQVVESPNAWGAPKLLLHEGQDIEVLDNWDRIREVTGQGLPLVSQTELSNQDTSLKATIECPVKTMNISLEKQMYQVDTGPIAFPDLSRRSVPLIDCLQLAFVAFNQADFADFVIEQPTAVIENEEEVCSIYHYSNAISLPAVNRLLSYE